jgi:hypothetical protein
MTTEHENQEEFYMNRVFITLFALVLLALAPAQSQETPKPQNTPRCSLTSAQAPTIRGSVKLGMSMQELLSVFPGKNEVIKHALDRSEGFPNFGVARLNIYTTNDEDRFAGIESIDATVFDGRVAEIRVSYLTYPRGPQWLKVDDFIAKLSEAFTLQAAEDWGFSGDTNFDSKTLTCSGWEIEATIFHGGGAGSFKLRNSVYNSVVKERAAADAERKRREFRP